MHLAFSLIIVLIYLGLFEIPLDGRNLATGFSPSMNSDNYLKVPYSFCWIFFDMPQLYIVAYFPIITSISLSVVLLLKMRIVMLQRASDDVELKNRFMRIHSKLRGFPLITLVWWLPMLLYWLFAMGKHDPTQGPFPIWIIMLHITFPSFFVLPNLPWLTAPTIKYNLKFQLCSMNYFAVVYRIVDVAVLSKSVLILVT